MHVTPRPMHFALNHALLLGSLFCPPYSSKPWLILLLMSPLRGSREGCGCPGRQLGQIRSYVLHRSCKGKFWVWAWPGTAGSVGESPHLQAYIHKSLLWALS